MRKLFFTFAVLAPLFASADIPPSTIPASAVPASTVAVSTVPETQTAAAVVVSASIAPSRAGSYRGWAEAAAKPCAFPTRRARFVSPVDPVMLQINNPAAVDELIAAAINHRLTGRTVYFCYSPYRTQSEVYEFADVLAAVEKLAPFCDAFAPAFRRTGAHLPRGTRREIYDTLKAAGATGVPLIEVLPRGLPPHKRYRHHLVIDINNDN